MDFEGFNVNSIDAFRSHFSVKEMIEAIKNIFVMGQWLKIVEHEIDEAEFQDLRRAFENWKEKRKPESCYDDGSALCRAFAAWRERLASKQAEGGFESFRAFFLKLLQLARCEALKDSELKLIEDALVDWAYIHSAALRLERIDAQSVGVFDGGKLLGTKACPAADLPEGALYVARHPDTGYIEIMSDGGLVNASAFDIPELGERAVMVDLNQYGYMVLLESGRVAHNLRHLEKGEPSGRVMALSGYGFA